VSQPAAAGRSVLSDGEWHRLHPLTPLLRGGLVLVVVIGVIIANLRDRLVQIFLPMFVPQINPDEYAFEYEGDPIDWVVENNLVLLAGLALVVVLVLVVAGFYLSWRFHTFRITRDEVEVRSGILFRTHRRAKLDRVQGVNLTRPMIARLLGTAKLEVVGAGADGNVKLEYLSTVNAEQVRADILRLASGRQLDAQPAPGPAGAPGGALAGAAALSAAVSHGVTGLIVGEDVGEVEPESVVRIPVGRLLLSHLLSPITVLLVVAITAVIVGAALGTPWLLIGLLPVIIGFGAFWLSSVFKGLRYSIAPTRNGIRITYGLFTTITEIIPPGRINAIEIRQSILWRPAGWWTIKINRITGKSVSEGTQDQFTTVLPVGTRADVERVMGLLVPEMAPEEWPALFEQGVLGPRDGDPFTNTPRRARIFTLLSWKRNGFALNQGALLLRRGVVWRTLSMFPFARMQSVALHQGPFDRMLRVADVQVHTVLGPISGRLSTVDRDAALELFAEVERRTAMASAADHSHRWAADVADAVAAPATVPPLTVAVQWEAGEGGQPQPQPQPQPRAIPDADAPGRTPEQSPNQP